MTSTGRLSATLADRYRIERELGAGGMATVYLAEDVRHRRKVALKVLHPELSAVLGSERFLKEIELTANLQHPHILPLFDSGSADGQLFYVMPYVEGESLRARLERERQLPVPDAVRVAQEVADALQYAHERGVIHRDIKPENILLHGGHALVADFGIALAVQQAGGQRMTQTGLSLGTPQYMSPEQAMGEKSVDARTDIYSLGAVTYEMLTGEPPFSGATVQAIVAKVLTERPMAPSAVRDTVTPGIEQAVLRALAKLPADRFASTREFGAALGSEGSTTVRAATPRASIGGAWSAGRVLPWAVAVAGVAIGAWGWLSGRSAPQPTTRVAVAFPPNQELRPRWRGNSVSVSPDGSRFAYIGTGPAPGTTQVWLRALDALDAMPVPNTLDAQTVKWSTNGRSLLISSAVTGRGGTIVSLSGGEATPIPEGFDGELGASGAVYVDLNTRILRRNPQGTVDTLVRLQPGTTVLSLTVSDDERTALVSVTTDSARLYANARLLELDLRSGQSTDRGKGVLARRLRDGRMLVVQSSGEAFVTSRSGTPTGSSLGRVAFSANSGQVYPQISVADDGTLLFVAGVIGRSRLTWLDVNGNVVSRRNTEGNMWGIALSPDGSRVAYSDRADERTEGARSFGLAAVWVEDLRSGARTRLADADMNVRPSWSPDGQSVLWTRVGLGTGGFFERRADASAPERRVVSRELFARSQGDARWHPDHRTLLLRTFAQPSVDIYAVTPGGPDSSVRPVAVTPASEANPSPSPDGSLLAYNSDESGTSELYVQPWPSGQGRLQISRGGGGAARWSHDGRKLYYWNERQNLVEVTLLTRPRLAIGSVSETMPDANPGDGSANSNVLFDVAPDGRILVAEPVTNSYQLILVRNGLRPTDAGKAR